jgi:hypothetical protein
VSAIPLASVSTRDGKTRRSWSKSSVLVSLFHSRSLVEASPQGDGSRLTHISRFLAAVAATRSVRGSNSGRSCFRVVYVYVCLHTPNVHSRIPFPILSQEVLPALYFSYHFALLFFHTGCDLTDWLTDWSSLITDL